MISDIRLQHFRSYADATFEFGKSVNIIVGPNASGKTNLLEAIQMACLGTSFRAKDKELVQFSKPWARLDVHENNKERAVKITITPQGSTQKIFSVNGRSFKRLPTIRKVPMVLFEPEYLRLLTGPPERRRDFLDDLLQQIIPNYGTVRRDYRRILAQRNTLLKKSSAAVSPQIFAWNIRLSDLGSYMAAARHNIVDSFNKDIQNIYSKIAADKKTTKLVYASKFEQKNYASQMLGQLEKDLNTDMLKGFTGSGPHRDDMQVLLGGHDAQESASRGEMRTLLLALKMLELRLLENARGQKPILLLDDVFSELDGARRQALTKFLKNYQTFITTTDADIVVQHFIGNHTIIPTAN